MSKPIHAKLSIEVLDNDDGTNEQVGECGGCQSCAAGALADLIMADKWVFEVVQEALLIAGSRATRDMKKEAALTQHLTKHKPKYDA